jgi:hypothetical protein
MNGRYNSCFRSVLSCRELHMQHFGKYPDRDESRKALNRCKSSQPRRDFVDNRNGLYVCYDYRDSDGYYSGCFRSLKSCSSLNKKHFGRYGSRHESRKALQRCIESLPGR